MRTIRTARARATFLAALRTSANVTTAATAAKISRRAAYEWRDDDAEFAAAWDDALGAGLDDVESAMVSLATTLRNPDRWTVNAAERAAEFILKTRRREVYGERTEVTHKGSITVAEAMQELVGGEHRDPA